MAGSPWRSSVTVGGSQQLRRFRIAIRDGAAIEDAAEQNGMTIGEARSWIADDAKNPPPPEAFILLGHNSGENTMPDTVAADQLRLLIERIERLEEEKKGLAEDIKDVFAESKSNGYDVKTMRKVLARRKMERHHLQEADALLATYCTALGMQMSFDI